MNAVTWSTKSNITVTGDNSDSSKPVIVFVHGGPGLSHHYFLPLMESLSAVAICLSYDQGTQLKILPATWSIRSLVEELNFVIEENFKGKEVILFAHSFGSVIALEYACKFNKAMPLILASWIYNNEWLQFFSERNPDQIRATKSAEDLNTQENDPKIQLKNRMRSYLEYYFPMNHQEFGRKVFENLNYYPTITEDIEAVWMQETNTVQNLEEIESLILSLSGISDRIIFPEYIAKAKEINMKIDNQLVPGGHFPFLDNVEGTNKHILKFLLNLN